MFIPTVGYIPQTQMTETDVHLARLELADNNSVIRVLNYRSSWYTQTVRGRKERSLNPLTAYDWLAAVLKHDEIVEGFNNTEFSLRRSCRMDRLHVIGRGSYVVGLMEAGDELFEFCPGRVVIHNRLPEHFNTQIGIPAIDFRTHNTEYVRAIYNPTNPNYWTLCMDQEDPGRLTWVNQERSGIGTRTNWIPGTTGLAIRKIYPPTPNWWNVLLSELNSRQRWAVNQLRSGYRSYERTHPRVIELYHELSTNFPNDWNPKDQYVPRFYDTVRRFLLIASEEAVPGEGVGPDPGK